MAGWMEAGNKGRSGPATGRRGGGEEKEEERRTRESLVSSRNITNPKVVFTSLCAMIPGGIVKA